MIRLVLTTVSEQVTVQDPNPSSATPESTSVINVAANTTKNVDMPWGQLERIRPQLDALEAMGLVTFSVESTGDAAYADQADAAGNPVIDYTAIGAISGVTQSVVLTGTNLLGEGSIASVSVAGDTVAGSVTVEAATPGNTGNLIDVVVTNTGLGGLAVSVAVVLGRTVVTVNLGGSVAETCATVAAIINNPASATYGVVFATVVGAGGTAITVGRALAHLTGGTGTGMAVTLGGVSCTVLNVNVSADPIIVVTLLTPSLPFLLATEGAPLNLQLRSNGKATNVTIDPISQQALGGVLPAHAAANNLAPYVPTNTDYIVGCDTSAGAVAINLGALAGYTDNKAFIIKDEANNANALNITVTPNGAELLDGVNAAITIATDSGVLRVYKRAGGWFTW